MKLKLRVVTVAIMGLLILMYSKMPALNSKMSAVEVMYKPSPECLCLDEATGRSYDFCYLFVEPQTQNMSTGRRFSCEWMSILKRFNLLETSLPEDTINPFYWEIEKNGIPEVVFVSAASANHYSETKRLMSQIAMYFPTRKMIVYDLGLTDYHKKEIKEQYSFVEIRLFPFKKYPQYFTHLSQFRWKPIVIAETLAQFPAIWYMDSSVVWHTGELSNIYKLLECRKNSHKPYQRPKVNTSPVWLDANFTDQELLQTFQKRCDKFAYLLQGWTGHGIFSATHPSVYEFFPTSLSLLKKETSKMYEAGFALIVRTKEVIEKVLKWYVLCALEENCMAPNSSSLGCRFKRDRYGEYADCHRYDQSVVNLLLANENAFDCYFFTTSGLVKHFNIVRGA